MCQHCSWSLYLRYWEVKTNNSIKHSYNAGFWLYKSLITFSTTLCFFCCNIYDKMSTVFSLVRGRCVSRALNFLLYNKIQSNSPTDTPIYLNLKVKNLAWYERVTVEGSDSCGTETVFQLTLWGLIHVYTFHVCKCSRVRSGLSDEHKGLRMPVCLPVFCDLSTEN